VLIFLEKGWSFAAGNAGQDDLGLELAGRLRRAEALLGAQRPLVLLFTADAEFPDQVFGVLPRRLIGKRAVQPVTQHAIVKLPIA
jgi:hypothetical protein